jgi:hypothetical protein
MRLLEVRMLIDCDTCQARGDACADCVVSVMLGIPGMPPTVDVDEVRAIAVLAESGLVPPLRLVTGPATADDVTPPARIGQSDQRAV